MTNTGADMHTMTLEKGLAIFLDGLAGKNRSAATVRAYQTDIQQFLSYLHATNVSIHTPADVEKVDVVEYFSSLAKRELRHPNGRKIVGRFFAPMNTQKCSHWLVLTLGTMPFCRYSCRQGSGYR